MKNITKKQNNKFNNSSKIRVFTRPLVHLLAIAALFIVLPAYSYEDCIISTNGKMTDIKIQHNDIIDVFPLVTLMNDKNTIIVHPLKVGKTKFSILKNQKDKYIFDVEVRENETIVDEKEGFDILTVDCPPDSFGYDFLLDKPPFASQEELLIDTPPMLRKEKSTIEQ